MQYETDSVKRELHYCTNLFMMCVQIKKWRKGKEKRRRKRKPETQQQRSIITTTC